MAAAAIATQVEFYFGESNLRKDKFLRNQIAKDADGFVDISVLLTFNKLKQLSTDVSEIAKAVKDSDLVAVSDDNTKIKRTSDIPLEDTSKARTLYAKGYPVDDDEVTIESIKAQFDSYGEVLMVRLRKDPKTKAPKGSAFIEFAAEDSVTKAVAASNSISNDDKDKEKTTVTLKWKDTPLLCVMTLVDWLARKEAKRVKKKGKF